MAYTYTTLQSASLLPGQWTQLSGETAVPDSVGGLAMLRAYVETDERAAAWLGGPAGPGPTCRARASRRTRGIIIYMWLLRGCVLAPGHLGRAARRALSVEVRRGSHSIPTTFPFRQPR